MKLWYLAGFELFPNSPHHHTTEAGLGPRRRTFGFWLLTPEYPQNSLGGSEVMVYHTKHWNVEVSQTSWCKLNFTLIVTGLSIPAVKRESSPVVWEDIAKKYWTIRPFHNKSDWNCTYTRDLLEHNEIDFLANMTGSGWPKWGMFNIQDPLGTWDAIPVILLWLCLFLVAVITSTWPMHLKY